MLAPLALSTHVWFVANATGFTVLAILAPRTLALGSVLWGLLLATAGATALLGASLAELVGERLGEGTTVVMARGLYPLAGGLENPSEMSLRQKVTPGALLGRVNATMRSANRTSGAIGAILGGVAAALLGMQGEVIAIVAVFVVAALIAVLSPVRGARP